MASRASAAASAIRRRLPIVHDWGGVTADPANQLATPASYVSRYRHLKAVDGLSFTAKPGEVTGFLGPNGAGKTTTISMILGLTEPDGGEAEVAGKPFRELDDPAGTVGAVLAGGAFHDRRLARASLHAAAAAAGLPSSRIDEVLDAVGLADAPNRHLGAYSLGMRQRLSLAQALLGDPDGADRGHTRDRARARRLSVT